MHFSPSYPFTPPLSLKSWLKTGTAGGVKLVTFAVDSSAVCRGILNVKRFNPVPENTDVIILRVPPAAPTFLVIAL